jgi:hypothetical protein
MILGLSAWDLLERLAVVAAPIVISSGLPLWDRPFYKLKRQKEDRPAPCSGRILSSFWGKNRYLLCNFFKVSGVMHVS